MALICDQCGARWGDRPGEIGPPGVGWWQAGARRMTRDGLLVPYLQDGQDFCSEACLRTFYTRPAADHATQPLPTGAAARLPHL